MDGKDANSIHKQVTVLLLSQVAIFNSLHLWQEPVAMDHMPAGLKDRSANIYHCPAQTLRTTLFGIEIVMANGNPTIFSTEWILLWAKHCQRQCRLLGHDLCAVSLHFLAQFFQQNCYRQSMAELSRISRSIRSQNLPWCLFTFSRCFGNALLHYSNHNMLLLINTDWSWQATMLWVIWCAKTTCIFNCQLFPVPY